MNLIEKAKTDPLAFGELYQTHVEALYQFVAFRVNTIKDAEDVSSQIWEKAFQQIHRLRSNEDLGFKCWLFKIARNSLTDYYRNHKVHLTLDNESPWIDSNPTPKQEIETKFTHDEMKKLINSLPEKQKETVILSVYGDYKNKEIAAIQRVSEKTVASNLSRALDFLEQHWENLQ